MTPSKTKEWEGGRIPVTCKEKRTRYLQREIYIQYIETVIIIENIVFIFNT